MATTHIRSTDHVRNVCCCMTTRCLWGVDALCSWCTSGQILSTLLLLGTRRQQNLGHENCQRLLGGRLCTGPDTCVYKPTDSRLEKQPGRDREWKVGCRVNEEKRESVQSDPPRFRPIAPFVFPWHKDLLSKHYHSQKYILKQFLDKHGRQSECPALSREFGARGEVVRRRGKQQAH